MIRRICRFVIGQFGFSICGRRRHCRCVVTLTSHIIGSQIKEGGTFEMQHILISRSGSEFGGFGGSYLLKTYPSTTRRYTYFATPIQVLRLTFSCRVPLGIGGEEAPVDTRVTLWVISNSQTSMCDHLSLATTSYKRPLIQNTKIFSVKTLW